MHSGVILRRNYAEGDYAPEPDTEVVRRGGVWVMRVRSPPRAQDPYTELEHRITRNMGRESSRILADRARAVRAHDDSREEHGQPAHHLPANILVRLTRSRARVASTTRLGSAPSATRPVRSGSASVYPRQSRSNSEMAAVHLSGSLGRSYRSLPSPEYFAQLFGITGGEADVDPDIDHEAVQQFYEDEFVEEYAIPEEAVAPHQRAYDNPSKAELAHRSTRASAWRPDAEDVKKEHPQWVCSLTLDVYRDPVVASDGQTYERRAIETWLSANNTSPLTGEQLVHQHLVENVALRSIIEQYVDVSNPNA